MTVTIGNLPFLTSSTYAIPVPTVTVNGSLFMVWCAQVSNLNTFTPSGGPTMIAKTPDSGTSSFGGHGSYMWYGTVNTSHSGNTITFTQSGSALKTMFLWALVDDPHASPFDRVVALAQPIGDTAHTTAASTTVNAGCIEIQAMFDSRGGSTPNTSAWTRPLSMEADSAGFCGGSTAFTSGSIGYNDTVLDPGTAIGGDTWTANQLAVGSSWLVSVRTTADAPELIYTRQRIETFDCTESTGGTPTLTKVSGPAITITESPTSFFTVEMPDVLSEDLVLDVALAGATTQREVISAETQQALRVVYNGVDWE